VLDDDKHCVATFINHSNNPNVILHEAEHDDIDRIDFSFLTIRAKEAISESSDLYLDYGSGFWKHPPQSKCTHRHTHAAA